MSQPGTVETPKSAVDLQTLVTQDIVDFSSNGELTNRVINVFVEREVKSRAGLLVTGIDELNKLAKAFADINKPDGKVFGVTTDADGNKTPSTTATETFSQKRLDEIGKARKPFEKLQAAVNAALSSPSDTTFAALKKVLGGGADKDTDE